MLQDTNLNMDVIHFNKNLAGRNHWKKRAAKADEFHCFTLLKSRETALSEINSCSIVIPEIVNDLLLNFAVSQPARHAVLLSALAVLIQKYHGVADVMILNPLPENHTSAGKVLPAYISTVQDDTFASFVKREFTALQDDIHYERYAVNPVKTGGAQLDGMVGFVLGGYQPVTAFDLFTGPMVFTYHEQGILTLRANSKNNSTAYLKYLADYYLSILSSLLHHPSDRLSGISLLSASEAITEQEKFNDVPAMDNGNSTVISHFTRAVLKYSAHTAQSLGESSLSYAELDAASNRFAAYLRDKEVVKNGDVIGVLLNREERLLTVLLGILKAGAAFVPMEVQWPATRINAVIAGSGMQLIISTSAYADKIAAGNTRLLNLDIKWHEVQNSPADTINEANAEGLAYVIYTSGSTGTPKGVMISHASLYNYISWANKEYVQGKPAVFPLYSSIAFDLTITSIFTPLLSGNTVVLYGGVESGLQIDKILKDNLSTVLKLTPSHLKLIRDNYSREDLAASKLETLIIGGEDLESNLAQAIDELFDGRVAQYNEYGPTEATVGCMIHRYNKADHYGSVPIGIPGAGVRIYVLDKDNQPVVTGAIGELYIAGKGLAKGYLNNETLTADKFIADPFKPGEQMYKTGDLAVFTPEGTLLYKGRKDLQVQLRGFRIELEEVSGAMEKVGEVKEAHVKLWQENGEDYLVAYYTGTAEADSIRAALKPMLPEYMQPSYYVQLESFPLTLNGKLAADQLPKPEVKAEANHAKPEGALEEQLAGIWAEVLRIDQELIGATRSFFELRGNSIKIIALHHRIFDAFGLEIALSHLFSHNTIQAQAQLIAGLTKTVDPNDLLNIVDDGLPYYDASPAQQRMYFQQQSNPQFTGFNICRVFRVSPVINAKHIGQYFDQLLQRHESLRTRFMLIDGQVKQIIEEHVFSVIGPLADHDDKSLSDLVQQFVKPFDLRKGPLLRLGLTRNIATGENVLLLDIHHIIADGYSLNILVDDLLKIIAGEALPAQNFQYRHYTHYLKNNADIDKQKQYWQIQLAEDIPVLTLPKITDEAMTGDYAARASIKSIPIEIYNQLQGHIAQTQTTTFTYLLAIFYVLLHKLTGDTDLIVGSDATGRVLPKFSGVVGTFVNILPLRKQLNPALNFDQLLSEVRELVLNGLDNQEFQFEQMVALTNRPDNAKGNPIVDIHFSTADVFTHTHQLDKLPFTPLELDRDLSSQYEFKVEVRDKGTGMDIAFVYLDNLYEEETIGLLLNYYIGLIKSSVEKPLQRIQDTALTSV